MSSAWGLRRRRVYITRITYIQFQKLHWNLQAYIKVVPITLSKGMWICRVYVFRMNGISAQSMVQDFLWKYHSPGNQYIYIYIYIRDESGMRNPKHSMYAIYAYICRPIGPSNHPNVGIYSIR